QFAAGERHCHFSQTCTPQHTSLPRRADYAIRVVDTRRTCNSRSSARTTGKGIRLLALAHGPACRLIGRMENRAGARLFSAGVAAADTLRQQAAEMTVCPCAGS